MGMGMVKDWLVGEVTGMGMGMVEDWLVGEVTGMGMGMVEDWLVGEVTGMGMLSVVNARQRILVFNNPATKAVFNKLF